MAYFQESRVGKFWTLSDSGIWAFKFKKYSTESQYSEFERDLLRLHSTTLVQAGSATTENKITSFFVLL